MLTLVTQFLYLTVLPVGLVLGSTPERLAVLVVATVLALHAMARRRSAAGAPAVVTDTAATRWSVPC